MEMNLHCPQSYEAHTELEEIAAVPMQIIRPRDGQPVIGIVQDTLVGAHLATKKNNHFNRREFMNLMMRNKRFEGLPAPGDNGKYTGQQIISTMLPPINLKMQNGMYDDKVPNPENIIQIEEGNVKSGIFDKGIFNTPGKGIVHTIYNDYGPKDTVDLIDGLQNVLENYLIMKGFSVGISDLIADEETKKQMEAKIAESKKEVQDIALQVHMDLFTNNTGKSNQEEFENRVNGALGRAADSGKIGQKSLSDENRLIAMIRAGSKGGPMNIAQMIACVGQQNPEGKRIPYGFTDRTLPHYKKFDDGPEARGFVESSFLRGLNPQEFFFHAMSGREGLIDTAVKSVTGDTPIVVLEEGVPKYVEIGPWIDAQLDAQKDDVQHYEERQMELLDINKKVFIPTMDEDGVVSWGALTAITRHDPGTELYEIKTSAGKRVIVTESKSLLIWNAETEKFKEVPTPTIKVGDYVPVTMNLCEPPRFIHEISMEKYFPKDKYIHGTEFNKASQLVSEAMIGRSLIPNGWWEEHNGYEFTLPYTKKASLTRALGRSNTENIKDGCIYPYHASREHSLIPDKFTLDNDNGKFIGLFLAEGHASIKSGQVNITNINENVKTFVKDWFAKYSIKYEEKTKTNHIGGTTTTIVGYSSLLATFLNELVGHGAHNKFVPSEAFVASEEFIIGLLSGYFSGDGTVTRNSVEAGSASARLTEGISMLLTRLGIFGKVFTTQTKSNNLGTENIAPSHRIAVRAQWAKKFADKIALIDDVKDAKLKELQATEKHRNYPTKNDVVLDRIEEINIIDVAKYPKVYDLTIPSTLNFGLANGLQVRDTSDTGYTQRQLIKAMEDLMIQHDGTVRDANGNIIQFYYGEDGINSTKIENISLPLDKLSEADIRAKFTMAGADLSGIIDESVGRTDDAEALQLYAETIIQDRQLLVEKVYGSGQSVKLNTPLNLERIVLNIKVKFHLDRSKPTDLTPIMVLNGINRIIAKTQPYNRIWAASLRFHLAPHKMIVDHRFTVAAWESLLEAIMLKNIKSAAVPGELVGIIAAQSIGEPTTQLTLNEYALRTGRRHIRSSTSYMEKRCKYYHGLF
jgi:intein/homing endonuclease